MDDFDVKLENDLLYLEEKRRIIWLKDKVRKDTIDLITDGEKKGKITGIILKEWRKI